jgi:ParB family chromosome partitioning protein
MQIQEIEIEKLIPYQNNARTHSAAQIESLAQSIAKFQWTQPIVIDEKNIILAGHARYQAAQSLGEQTVPVIKLEGLSENDKKAYRLVDNKLALDSDWDYDLLKVEIAELQLADYDLEPFNLEDLAFVSSEALSANPSKEKEFNETISNDVVKCCCPNCGHEHAKR